MKARPARLFAFTGGHPPQKRARSITTTEATSRDPRSGLIIAAIHPVFVSTRGRFTATRARPRACGGPAITIMHPVNSGAGVLVMAGIGGVPGITEIEDPPLRAAEKKSTPEHVRSDAPNKRDYHLVGACRASNRLQMRKSSAKKNSARAMLLVAAGWSILGWTSASAIAQHLADRQNSTVPTSTAPPSIIATDGELKATIFAYRDSNLTMQYKYYWWRDACYLTYEPTNFAPVSPAACY
jgi:hypothetical protein